VTEPGSYDVEGALQQLGRARLEQRDPLRRETIRIADKLAHGMMPHFTQAEADIAGRALVLTAASIGALVERTTDPVARATTNVIAFAGQRLVSHARQADPATTKPASEAPNA
jgi:hypothetical protein